MLHSNVLKALIPLELGGDSDGDLAIEAQALDTAQASAETLLYEMLPSQTYALLNRWEYVTGLAPLANEPLQSRRDKVVRKLQELGDIKKPYYVGLAAALGYQIYIEEYLPTMAGWVEAGDELLVQDDARILFIWNIHIFNQAIYNFHAGQSTAGEYLAWWRPALELENSLDELRPAHVHFLYSYQ